jgi:tetraprenyl-beta-curcumene synthase
VGEGERRAYGLRKTYGYVPSHSSSDPLPLTKKQVAALTRATSRQIGWGIRVIHRELREWERRAAVIPDGPLRADAARSFESKRGNSTGAAIFSGLTARRNPSLLKALIAFQIIGDFLDDSHERHPTAANGRLFRALVDAVSPDSGMSDYYDKHPWKEDRGYLVALVEGCRAACRKLPSFSLVQEALAREARLSAQAMRLNHATDPAQRDRALHLWVQRELPQEGDWRWFELTAAASGQLMILGLLALAAKPGLQEVEVTATYEAYWPTVPLLATMLDSYLDYERDLATGAHPYVTHYGTFDDAAERLTELIGRGALAVAELPEGQHHAVIFSCMVAFYMAGDGARAPASRPHTERMIRAGGSLTRALAPVLRAWRIAYSQQAV